MLDLAFLNKSTFVFAIGEDVPRVSGGGSSPPIGGAIFFEVPCCIKVLY